MLSVLLVVLTQAPVFHPPPPYLLAQEEAKSVQVAQLDSTPLDTQVVKQGQVVPGDGCWLPSAVCQESARKVIDGNACREELAIEKAREKPSSSKVPLVVAALLGLAVGAAIGFTASK